MDSVAIFDEGGAAGQEVAWWPGQEAARAPAPFRDRVLAQFQSPQNLSYLSGLFARQVPAGPLRDFTLATLQDALLQYSGGAGRALELLASDPIARRGALRPAVGLWDEVRRLNRAFYEDRLAFLREQAHTIERGAPRDGVSEDDEPYHMRMFISDSLRPPGLEGLNLVGLKRRGMSRETINDLRSAYRLLFADEGTFQERVADVAETYAASPEVMEIVAFIQSDANRPLCLPGMD